MLKFDRPSWATHFPELVIAQSQRHGGGSPAPWGSLNLGLNTADDPSHVAENRKRWAAALDVPLAALATSYQVHGTEIQEVMHPGRTEGYDALVTDRADIFLAVTIADCTPILIYDPVQQVVAAAHAGWRGTVGQIAARTLCRMQTQYGCEPANCWAYIGTCIGKNDFAVDLDVAQYFAEAYKYWDAAATKYFVDLKAVNRQQLLDHGVPIAQVEQSPHSTVARPADYFSYRHAGGRTGRMLALIGFRKRGA